MQNHFKNNMIMEIKITSNQLLKALHVLSWIIFIGLCIEAGGILCNAVYALAFQPIAAKNLWMGADLSALYTFDKGYFATVTMLMSITAILKTILFYVIVRSLYHKRLNMIKPFNPELKQLISRIAYLALGVSLFSIWGVNQTKWLIAKGVEMPDVQLLKLSGADVWMFMGLTLLVIAQIVKRGMEMQSENDLTI